MPPKVSRRGFLKLGVTGTTWAVLAGCERPRRWVTLEPYVEPPEEGLTGEATWYASTCRQCPAGCGILVRTLNGRAVKLEGNPEHPLNRGKLCARGQAGLQVLYNPDRLPGPIRQRRRGSRKFEPLDWNEALNRLFEGLRGAGSEFAVWAGSTLSGHMLDLYQRFTAALGAPEPLVFDLYSTLNGYRTLFDTSAELFGEAALPSYDLGGADVIFSFNADFLGPWISATRYGMEFGRLRSQLLGKRGYLVQFEPRMSTTGAKADRWIPIRPGTEPLVAQAIAGLIAEKGFGPPERVARAREMVERADSSELAGSSQLSEGQLLELAQIFGEAERSLAIPGAPLAGRGDGRQATMAVQALNLITGAVGEEGGLILTPQTGRILPPHIVPASLGEVQSLLERMRSGQVKVLLVDGANPAYDLPADAGFAEALAHVPFVVSFSPIVDETAVQADLILPQGTYLESWGYEAVTPSFGQSILGGQQPVVEARFDTRSTADVLLTVARGLPEAAKALPWMDEVAFLKEAVARLPLGKTSGEGDEVRWTRFLQHGGLWQASTDRASNSTKNAAYNFSVEPTSFQGDEADYPYYLHLFMTDLLSDGRGADQPWLQGVPDVNTTISWQSCVELNPITADQLGVQQGDVVRVTSPFGSLEAPVYLYPGVRPDTVAIPFGQGHSDYGRYARGRGSNAIRLLGAQSLTAGDELQWSNLRVAVEPTGEHVALATFEYSLGVSEGFINKGLPGG